MSWLQKPIARRVVLSIADFLLLAIAWYLAYSARFDFRILTYPDDDYLLQMKLLLPWVVLTHLVLLHLFRLYGGMVRYAGLREWVAIAGATVVHVGGWSLFNLLAETQAQLGYLPWTEDDGVTHVMRVPWSVLLLVYPTFAILFLGGLRAVGRMMSEGRRRFDDDAPSTLVVGAGNTAETALRDILRSETSPYRPVCAVAVERERVGAVIQGVRVRGTLDNIPDLLRDSGIQSVLIALDQSAPDVVRRVIRACEDAKVDFSIVPTLKDITSGRVDISPVRKVRLDDLLGRPPVDMALAAERNFVAGRTVLVTGAGGSIGRELCRQVLESGPECLVMLGKGENSLFEAHLELARLKPSARIDVVVGDVRDETRMAGVFAAHRPQVVFHAAAHKHVPLMESQAGEAVRNNVLGTAVVAHLAHEFGAAQFVMVSTDKAVRPTSVMGATKRVAEEVVFSLAGVSGTVFQVVRFGNVLGSRGSVVQLFERQIAAGGPVTVTHPDVTRYFMTIPEAVSLVLQAGARRESGRLYLLDMGSPVRIADLARSMIALSGDRTAGDIEIKYTGLRPGEKLHEELLTDNEGASETDVAKLWCAAPPPARPWDETRDILRELRDIAQSGDEAQTLKALRALVPEFHPAGEDDDADALRGLGERARRELEESVASVRAALGIDADTDTPLPPVAPGAAPPLAAPGNDPVDPDSQPAVPPEGGGHGAPGRLAEAEQMELPVEDSPDLPDEAGGPGADAPVPEGQAAATGPDVLADQITGPRETVEPITTELPLPNFRGDADTAPSPSQEEQTAEYEVQLKPDPEDVPLVDDDPEMKTQEMMAAPEVLDGVEKNWEDDDDPAPADAAPGPSAETGLGEHLADDGDLFDDVSGGEAVPAGPGSTVSSPEPYEIEEDAEVEEDEGEAFRKPATLESGDEADDPGGETGEPAETWHEGSAGPLETGEFLVPPQFEGAPGTGPAGVSATEPDPSGVVVLLWSDGSDMDEARERLRSVRDAAHGRGCLLLLVGPGWAASDLAEGVALLSAETLPPAEAWNWASEFVASDGWILAVDPYVAVNASLFEELEILRRASEDSDAVPVLAYGDYEELDGDGNLARVETMDHGGCPHERFDFGPVTAYRAPALRRIGGFDTELRYAWAYDAHLKLMQLGLFVRLPDVLCRRLAQPTPAESARLFSPGPGAYGGFSYLFYPEEVEREITAAFERALRDVGAWIDWPYETPPPPSGDHEVAASVVIPVLDREETIGNAIESVLGGTFQDFEVIVVDNGSTDGTPEVVREICARDERVSLIRGTGGTIASAINDGIRESRGEFICQLDSDDEYVPETLEKMVGALRETPGAGLAISYYRLMDAEGRLIEDAPVITHEGFDRNQVLRRDGAGALRVFRRSVLEEFGLYDAENYGNFGEDYDMVLKTSEKYRVLRVRDVLYHYRRHGGNTDVTRSPAMKHGNKNRARQAALVRRMRRNESQQFS